MIEENPTNCGSRISLRALNVSNNFRYKIIDLTIKRIKSDNSFKFKPSHVVYYCAMNNCFLYAENLVCIELKCNHPYHVIYSIKRKLDPFDEVKCEPIFASWISNFAIKCPTSKLPLKLNEFKVREIALCTLWWYK